MIKNLLKNAEIPAQEARFPNPPKTAYAVYFDEISANGADNADILHTHDATVELYCPTIQSAKNAEESLEVQLRANGICKWEKQSRYWLDDVQRYQIIYEFTFYEKKEGI